MLTKIEYIPIVEFGLKWRFAEDAAKWTVLADEDFANFRPLTEDCARSLWRELVSPDVGHLVALSLSGIATPFGDTIADYHTDDDWSCTEEAERVGTFLSQHIKVSRSSRLLFFWSASYAVETTWDVLLRYWSDFCYPSDDSNIAILTETDILIFYCEGLVWLARKRSLG